MKSKQPAVLHIEIKWHESVKSTSGGGVYMIYFGEKFYIGRTRCFESRKRSHERDLNKRMVNGRWTCAATSDFYQLVLSHLQRNAIGVAYMKLIKRCNTDDQLVAAEQKLFDKYEWDKNCLNLGFVATQYKEINEQWGYGPKKRLTPEKTNSRSSTVRYFDGTGVAKTKTREQINAILVKRRN